VYRARRRRVLLVSVAAGEQLTERSCSSAPGPVRQQHARSLAAQVTYSHPVAPGTERMSRTCYRQENT